MGEVTEMAALTPFEGGLEAAGAVASPATRVISGQFP